MIIGVIADRIETASKFIEELAKENDYKLLKWSGMIDCDDNKIVPISTIHSSLGVRLDQVIVLGDAYLINPNIPILVDSLLYSSCVPDKFKIIYVTEGY